MTGLEQIPGIGLHRQAMLTAFGNSIDAVKNTMFEDLMTVKGITAKVAVSLKGLL